MWDPISEGREGGSGPTPPPPTAGQPDSSCPHDGHPERMGVGAGHVGVVGIVEVLLQGTDRPVKICACSHGIIHFPRNKLARCFTIRYDTRSISFTLSG